MGGDGSGLRDDCDNSTRDDEVISNGKHGEELRDGVHGNFGE
jgi:hypothetical protein